MDDVANLRRRTPEPPAGHSGGERAIDSLILCESGKHVLYDGALAVAAAMQTWSRADRHTDPTADTHRDPLNPATIPAHHIHGFVATTTRIRPRHGRGRLKPPQPTQRRSAQSGGSSALLDFIANVGGVICGAIDLARRYPC
jgi:hypothetical protein